MQSKQTITFDSELSAVLIHADGSRQDYGVISGVKPVQAILTHPMKWYEKVWNLLKNEGKIPATMGLFSFICYLLTDHHASGLLLGIVTTTGAGYLATDFAAGTASPHIGAMNYHDCGTGGAHGSTSTPTAATAATPIVVTQAAHGFGTNDIIQLSGITGITGINGIWQITVNSSSTYTLIGSVGGGSSFGGGTNACQLVNGAGDTTLTTQFGGSRVAGTQSNPTSTSYKSIATIAFTSSLSISEWSINSASTSGTMWDRRWFNTSAAPAVTATGSLTASTIGTVSGDSIQFSYTLSVQSGGS